MSGALRGAAAEWRGFWFLPLAGALGYATSVLHVYSLGPFVGPLTEEFGWTRAQIYSGLTIASIISGLLCIPMGVLVDRIGPRRVGLVGVVLMGLTVSCLGTATGSQMNWLLLWAVVAIGTLGVQATVWTSAVASRFETSRGLAFAITLSGGALAAAVFPSFATWGITEFGWRKAYMLMAALWATPVLLLLLGVFRGAQDQMRREKQPVPARVLTGITFAEGLRSSVFYRLLLASGFFSFTTIGVSANFVPMLTDKGTALATAAQVAGIIGIFSVIGRLGAGVLIDRYPAQKVGAIIFLIPLVACLLLLSDGASRANQMIAAAIFGLTLGAEVDVIAYLATRFFGLRAFGALYGAMVMALSLGTAFGPLAAGMLFDRYGGYEPFLYLTMAMMSTAAVSVFSLGRPRALESATPLPEAAIPDPAVP
ncbi:MAG: MFS transporter [Sinimarinibacterium flocculans]|uniref:MFS transporter n=1 Tax=Sinimarinibacterium flocculans TaxID=985250 RepID=UPI003C56A991